MTDRILLIMPTRGRPWSALEAISSVMKHAAETSMVKIVICCDDDDSSRFGLFSHSMNIATVVRPRMRFVQWINHITQNYVSVESLSRTEWIGWLADDIRYQPPTHWDSIVREHKELVVWGEDGYQNEKMATHPFIRTAIPKALGYLLPSELVHYCPDVFIQELATEIGSIAYDPRIKTEHIHPDAGKGVVDQTHLAARDHWESDHQTYTTEIRPRIPALAKQVIEFMQRESNHDADDHYLESSRAVHPNN